MIERAHHDGIVTLRLAHGKASALDIELLDAIQRVFAEIRADDSARAVILTGTGSIFSAGVDLFRMTNEGAPYVDRFVPALTNTLLDVFTLPKPVVCAINGHAIAGGCVIAAACDIKLMAAGNGRIGMPEVLVGVPFPPSILEILRFAMASQHLQTLVYTGKTVPPDEALRIGLVDEVVDAASLITRANEVAHQLAAIPDPIFAVAKRELRDIAVHRAKKYAAEFDGDVAEVWRADATHARIREYLARTVGKK